MKKHNRKLSNGWRVRVMNFKPIVRAKAMPAETAKSLGLEKISGENRLEVRNEADETAHVYLSGAVGGSWWDDSGITEKETREALATIPKGKKIHVHINSEGGSVQEGLGIYNAFKERAADITAHIDGYACSIASVIPLAASKVISPDSAIWMIHCASCYCGGNADDMEQTVTMLRQHDEMLAEILAKETGQTIDKIRADMAAETWIRGSQAVDYGLADETGELDVTDRLHSLPTAWLDRCKNIPHNIYNALAPLEAPGAAISAPPQGTAKPPQTNNTKNIMTRAQILALLKSWGVSVTDAMTDEQLNLLVAAGKPETKPTDALATVKAQLADERKARITAEVTRRAENKIKNDQLDTIITMALADEAKAYAFIDSLTVANVASDPLGVGQVEICASAVLNGFGIKPTTTVENIFKAHSTPTARYEALKASYAQAMAEANRKDGCRPGVLNANSYSASLTTNFLIMGATIKAGPKFAPLKAFSRDVSVDPYKPLATGVMKFTTSVQDGSDVQTNATDFTTGDSTVTAVSISVAQYTASMNLTNSDLNSGIRMEDLALPKLRSLGSKLMQIATAPITAANYATLAGVVSAPGAFGFSELQKLWGQLKKANTKNLLLDGEYLANLTNVPTFFQVALSGGDNTWTNAFGWDLIALNTEWTGAGANVRGFACDPQAIGVINGLPIIDGSGIPGGILSVSTGMIPGANVPIACVLWFDTNKRTYYASFDSVLGAAKLDTSVGALITSA